MDRRFTWDARKAADNSIKHGVTFEEAREAFRDPFGVLEFDGDHSDDEDRFVLIAMSSRLRVLFIVHVDATEHFTRIISARHASAQEQARYEQTRR